MGAPPPGNIPAPVSYAPGPRWVPPPPAAPARRTSTSAWLIPLVVGALLLLGFGVWMGLYRGDRRKHEDERLRRAYARCVTDCRDGTAHVESFSGAVCRDSCRSRLYGTLRNSVLFKHCRAGSGVACVQRAINARRAGRMKTFEMALQIGCNHKSAQCCHRLGGWLKGRQRFSDAAKVLDRACELGRTASCQIVGMLYLDGQGVPRSLTKARSYLRKSCAHSDRKTCAEDIIKDHHKKLDAATRTDVRVPRKRTRPKRRRAFRSTTRTRRATSTPTRDHASKGCTVYLQSDPSRAVVFPAGSGYVTLGHTPARIRLKGPQRRVKVAKAGHVARVITLYCERPNRTVYLSPRP